MQLSTWIQVFGIAILVVGLLLIMIGMFLSSNRMDSEDVHSKTRGVILIGPIPIVFGSSRNIQILLCVFGIIATLILFVIFQL